MRGEDARGVLLVEMSRDETRLALIESGELVELCIERPRAEGFVGSIYKGRVMNVLPGMQAAFVDIGMAKNAFLYAGDVARAHGEPMAPIRSVVKVGQELLVQVVKEPGGDKGLRVTTQITLPGRFTVLTPCNHGVGVSRRIQDEAERARLKAALERLLPENCGFIARTNAEGRSERDIAHDAGALCELWEEIEARARHAKPPACVYSDEDPLVRAARDMIRADTERLVVNRREGYDRLRAIVSDMSPDMERRVELEETVNLLSSWGLDAKIERATHRKVWLKSGGYLVFDAAEALTVIDVNSGKFVGNTNLADTAFRLNQEAAREIATQLRLRDIGGIIVIDFVDMPPDRGAAIVEALREACRRDRSKTTIVGLTGLGLVEMTRRKARRDLAATLKKPCPVCAGEGKVVSEDTVVARAHRAIDAHFEQQGAPPLLVTAHPAIAGRLIDAGTVADVAVYVQADARMHAGAYATRALDGSEVVGERLSRAKSDR